MTVGVHDQLAALDRLVHLDNGRRAVLRHDPAEDGLHPLDEEPLGEGLADEIIGAHLEAEQLVDLVILRGEENHRHVGALAQAAKQLHAVHARHLDVENGHVRRIVLNALQGRDTVGIALRLVSFRFEDDAHRGENIAIVVDQCDHRHPLLTHFELSLLAL